MSSLVCNSLYKKFDGVEALADVTLELPTAGVIAIVGPNGAGKTTLVNVLSGFLRPNGGRSFLDGKEITGLPPYRVAAMGLSRTFQDLRLITQVTVLENVILGRRDQRGESLIWAICRLGVGKQETENREKAMQILGLLGIESRAGDRAGDISYGDQKLLSLACCLATEAGTMLLDEPIAGVHGEVRNKIMRLVRQLKEQGKLVIIIEHDMQAVREVADRVIVMDHGRVIAEGPPAEVLGRSDVMEAYID